MLKAFPGSTFQSWLPSVKLLQKYYRFPEPAFPCELKYPHSFLFYFYFGHLKYIYHMEAHYKTLQTIYTITKDDPQPERYKCRPREIILRQFQDWTIIQTHLQLLEGEELVTTKQEDTLVVCITSAGISKILNSENSAVAK
jgi:hypothetical protein